MAAGNLQSNLPVRLNLQPNSAKSSWPNSGASSAPAKNEDTVPFTRPAITTGAHLPWNVHKKASYGPPRTICPVQTVPPITILNSRSEATKLVYSKDSEVAAQLMPQESPFKQKSSISICDEEATQMRFNQGQTLIQPATNPATMRILQPVEDCRLDSLQASSGQMPSQLVSSCAPQSLDASLEDLKDRLGTELDVAKIEVKMEGDQNDWSGQMLEGPLSGPSGAYTMAQSDMAMNGLDAQLTGNSYAAESIALPSLFNKSSGDSSMLRMSDAGDLNDEIEHLEGSSRSHSLAEKRKQDFTEPLSARINDPQVYVPDTKENSFGQHRAVRRRLTSRSATKGTADKKNQEFARMERLVEKLKNEQFELQSKLKRHVKTCAELEGNLSATQQKLKAQEKENSRLKDEMQFLRDNLSMLPQAQAGFEGAPSLGEVSGSPIHGQLLWSPEFPYPTGMPTQAQIAADLELDRQLDKQLLSTNETSQEFLKEWIAWS